MKISNNGITNASLKGKESVQVNMPQARDAPPDLIAQNSDLYIPSDEWLRIQTLLHKQPEIRNDRVALAGDRLKAAYYLTEDSAQETAVAMLNSVD